MLWGGDVGPPNAEPNEIPIFGMHRNKYLGLIKDAKCQEK